MYCTNLLDTRYIFIFFHKRKLKSHMSLLSLADMFHKICIISLLCAFSLCTGEEVKSVREAPQASPNAFAFAGTNQEFSYFVYKVKADDVFYTGLLLSSSLLLTDKKVIKSKVVIVCDVKKICEGAIGLVDTPAEKNYIYVIVARTSESVAVKNAMYKGGKFNLDSCITLGIDHDPGSLISFEKDVLECDCKHLDGLVCNGEILGAITIEGTKKTVVPFKELLDYGNEISGINQNEEKMEEVLEELQSMEAERTTMGVRASDADTINKNFVIVTISFMLALHGSYITILKGK